MEFRCRVATPAGDVRDEVHVADTEVRLRRELEDRGLVLLAARPAGGLSIPGLGLPVFRMPTRRRLPQRHFLVFNQELATLLKAGMPLVQSLDILRQRVEQPVFKQLLDDVYEQVRGGTALSDAFASHGDLVPGIYTASLLAGEKSGGLEQVLRRYVAYVKMISGIRRKTDLGDGLSRHPDRAVDQRRDPHRGQGGAGLCRFLCQLRPGTAVADAGHHRALDLSHHLVAGGDRRHPRGRHGDVGLVTAAGPEGPDPPVDAAGAAARPDRAEIRDVATGADGGHVAHGGHPAGQRAVGGL